MSSYAALEAAAPHLFAAGDDPWRERAAEILAGEDLPIECKRCGSTEHEGCHADPVEYPGDDLLTPDEND